MDPLANILERFNRKERNLLIRDILGDPGTLPRLASDFCERLAKTVAITKESLESAWWATDYHFDWLAGALLTFMKGETQNPQENGSGLVKGNQEDVDLVVVVHVPAAKTPHHLIMIEAKGYGHFTNEQYENKIARLEKLYAFYRKLEEESPRKITFHYVLYSPTSPPNLVPKRLPWQSNVGTGSEHVHLMFTLPKPAGSSILAVKRCNDKAVPDKEGSFWRCIPVPPHENARSEASSLPSSDATANGQ
jgi:hypothetical protein